MRCAQDGPKYPGAVEQSQWKAPPPSLTQVPLLHRADWENWAGSQKLILVPHPEPFTMLWRTDGLRQMLVYYDDNVMTVDVGSLDI